MQGRTQSSASIWTAFNNITTAFTRTLKHQLRVSWKRAEDTTTFAVIGTSVVGGVHLIKGLEEALTSLDSYQYIDETDRVVSLTYDRVLNEPLGGISQAVMDIDLDNTDGRYTPEQNTTIGTALLPRRPVSAQVGFLVQSQNKTVPVFKGLTLQPKVDESRRIMKLSCVDLVGYLYNIPMDSALYTDQRTDQVIQSILTDLGFGSSQYALDVGLNTVDFVWFEKGVSAGERIKKLCESEEAIFFADESGILRFQNRNHYSTAPYNADVWDIDRADIIAWEQDDSAPVYNKITVKAKPRAVQSLQNVWVDAQEEQIAPSNGAGLKAYYRFENGALTTDSSGNSHTLTAISDPAEDVSGKFGSGIALDGNDAYSSVDHADFKPTGNFSVIWWVKANTVSALSTGFQSYSANTNVAGIYTALSSTGLPYFIIGKNTGTTANVDYKLLTGSTEVDNNVWHMVVFTWDGSNMKIYTDGGTPDTVAWANAPAYAVTNYVRVGCGNNSGTNVTFLTGSLDDVSLINGIALTQAQVTSLYTTEMNTYKVTGGTVIWANLDDPATSITSPAATTDYTAFTGTGGTGSNITSNQTVSVESFYTAVKITILNNYTSTAYFNLLKLRGTPATVTGEILEEDEDATSIDKYDEQKLVIENDFIESSTFADTLAGALVDKYSEPTFRVNLTIQGIPQLQLRDWVRVEDSLNVQRNYRVMRIQGTLQNGFFSQKLALREITANE